MLKSGLFRFYAPLRIPSKRKRLPVVKFWNYQSQNNCVLKKWGNSNCIGLDNLCVICYCKQGTGVYYINFGKPAGKCICSLKIYVLTGGMLWIMRILNMLKEIIRK